MILIFGGTGRVGSTMKSIGTEAVFLGSSDYDLRNLNEVRQCLDKYDPDQVVHLAATCGSNNASRSYEYFYDNVLMGLHLIDECIKRDIRIVIVSSSAAYHGVGTPKEGELHDAAPNTYNFSYAFAKRLPDTQIRASRYKNSIILYPTNLYGPYDTFGEGCHVIPSLLTKMVSSDRVDVKGSDSVRQFLFLGDFARVIELVLQDKSINGELNVSPPKEHTIKEIALILKDVIRYRGELIFTSDGERKVISHKKFDKLFPHFCFTEINEGLKRFYEWTST